MKNQQIIERLIHLLNDLEAAYYGGFRTTTDEEDHKVLREAIKKLSAITDEK